MPASWPTGRTRGTWLSCGTRGSSPSTWWSSTCTRSRPRWPRDRGATRSWSRSTSAAPETLPEHLTLGLELSEPLRYGENPHQRAALYRQVLEPGPMGGAAVLQGKEMSFNNWLDAEAARGLAGSLPEPAAVIVKHHNPCGAAVADTAAGAYRAALASDPVSAFGGVVAYNVEVDEAVAEAMAEVFTEVVVAPGFTDAALSAFAERKNLRVVAAPAPRSPGLQVRALEGGALVQDADRVAEAREDMKVVTRREPTDAEWSDLLFAWAVAARVKSNAIVLAGGGATVGVGAGQMSRVDAVDIAARKAGPRARGAAMASDAFFPFRDGIDRAAVAGVTAVVQPGGSVRDDEVTAAAEEHGKAAALSLVLLLAACTREQPAAEQPAGGGPEPGGQAAEDGSLLQEIQGRGILQCGVNNTVPGFGFETQGQIEGFDIDFCKAFAAAVFATDAPEEGTHFELSPVDADARFNALRAGEFDVLVRNTTWTSSRDGGEGVAFAHPNYYDGQAMLAPEQQFGSIEELDGAQICVTAGTTTELNLADYFGAQNLDFEPVVLEDYDQIFQAFRQNRCDAVTGDRSALAGLAPGWEEEGNTGPLVIF